MSYHRCGGGKQSIPTIKKTKYGPFVYAWATGQMSVSFNLKTIPNYSELVLNENFFVEVTSIFSAASSSVGSLTWSYNAATGILTCKSSVFQCNTIYVYIRVVSIE